MKLNKKFFSREADKVAKDLIGKILIRKIRGKCLRFKIVETEAYFGMKDPSSRASKGKNKISEMMWKSPGKIMIYNVHKYKMFNVVTGKKGIPSAVLIRALEPLNSEGRFSGPGLLTENLKIGKEFHGKEIFSEKDIKIMNSFEKYKIGRSKRIGVREDLEEPFRFFIEENRFVSGK